jgi:hypothetical protein
MKNSDEDFCFENTFKKVNPETDKIEKLLNKLVQIRSLFKESELLFDDLVEFEIEPCLIECYPDDSESVMSMVEGVARAILDTIEDIQCVIPKSEGKKRARFVLFINGLVISEGEKIMGDE